ncbi:TPA: AmmeMemoRadiSam system protein B [Candidatus Marinimicrobia bacterium]|nr:MAG: Putative dioxygenase [Marinimicrobia bacterium 46_47]KUK92616.1 MAG: Putative dioxygenase [Marinimicrobia bacterium 46_43]HAE87803.1 AmmeMemoRadiSam system protein B [Candidatus Neomarinimicrobiota bacterium]HBY18444.1 AmmeMemoRadiSam system protein B [Candidatus Neomarinimicrobiota bacterium]
MIRQSSVAGQFYPGSPRELTHMIRVFLENAENSDLKGKISGLVVPHAGYIYSGQRAAEAYKSLSGKMFKNILVISPSHREFFDFISIYPGEGYETPLGILERTEDFDKLIESSPGCRFSESGHGFEHALEVQLPFLQVVLGDGFRLLPVVMGNQDEKNIEYLAHFLKAAKAQDPDLLIIASSDLSHFHSSETARRMDGMWINAMKKYDIETLENYFFSKTCEACGGGGIIALMKALYSGNTQIRVTGYTHSGEINRDDSSVVGYTSAVITEV